MLLLTFYYVNCYCAQLGHYSSVRRIFERERPGNSEILKINEDQNENFPAQNQVRLPAQKLGEDQKRRSSLKFSQVFGPKLGVDQKKSLHSNLVKALANRKVSTHRF